jgi:hypothetical protein
MAITKACQGQSKALNQNQELPYDDSRVMAGKKKPKRLKKSAMIRVLVTTDQKKLIAQAAATTTLDLSTWVRSIAVAEAQRLVDATTKTPAATEKEESQ